MAMYWVTNSRESALSRMAHSSGPRTSMSPWIGAIRPARTVSAGSRTVIHAV